MTAMMVGGRLHGQWIASESSAVVIPDLPRHWIAADIANESNPDFDIPRVVTYYRRWAKVPGWKIYLPFWMADFNGDLPRGTVLPGYVVGERLEQEWL